MKKASVLAGGGGGRKAKHPDKLQTAAPGSTTSPGGMGAGGQHSWEHPGCAEQHRGGEPRGVNDAHHQPGPEAGMCV